MHVLSVYLRTGDRSNNQEPASAEATCQHGRRVALPVSRNKALTSLDWRTLLLMALGTASLCGCATTHTGASSEPISPTRVVSSSATHQPPPPKASRTEKRVLQAMAEANTFGHPDLFGEFMGFQRLYKGDYAGALKYFKYGARFADKTSQAAIAMMYLNGRGVTKDAAVACGWLMLASQRKYPEVVRTKDHVCSALAPVQRRRARAKFKQLLPVYGDKVAKKRMRVALAEARLSQTGSLIGLAPADNPAPVLTGSAQMLHPLIPAQPLCGNVPPIYVGTVRIPQEGCGTYDPKLWTPENYFAARAAQWTGTVTVGPIQPQNTKDLLLQSHKKRHQ